MSDFDFRTIRKKPFSVFLGGLEVAAAGIAAVGGHLSGWPAVDIDVALEHGQQALGIGRIAGLDHHVEDHPALARGQVELVAVVHVAETDQTHQAILEAALAEYLKRVNA